MAAGRAWGYLVWEPFETLLKVECGDCIVYWVCVLELRWNGHSLKKLADLWHSVDVSKVISTLESGCSTLISCIWGNDSAKVPDWIGVSIAWLICLIICYLIAVKRFVGWLWIMSVLWCFLDRVGDWYLNPLEQSVYFSFCMLLQFPKCGIGSLSLSMLLRAIFTEIFEVMAAWQAFSVKMILSELGCWQMAFI